MCQCWLYRGHTCVFYTQRWVFGKHHSAFAVRSRVKLECSADITGNLPGCLFTRATISFSVFLSVFSDGVVLFLSLSVIYYNENPYYCILCMEKAVIEWRWKVSVNQLIIFSCQWILGSHGGWERISCCLLTFKAKRTSSRVRFQCVMPWDNLVITHPALLSFRWAELSVENASVSPA